ncbi:MBL fold metallo-hydrolase [Paenibacillus tarimensis]
MHVDHIGALGCKEIAIDTLTMAAPDLIKEVTRLERITTIKNKLPAEVSEQLLNLEMIEAEKSYYAMPNSLHVHRELQEGDQIDIGGEMLRVIYTPGHSFDHISLLHEPSGILIGGDILIKNGPPAITDLDQYVSSLDKLRTLSMSSVLPGHGPILTNPDEVIEQSIQRIIETDNRIIELLKSGPKSYYEIALGFTGGRIHKGILFFMNIVDTHVKRMLKNSIVAIQHEKLILV